MKLLYARYALVILIGIGILASVNLIGSQNTFKTILLNLSFLGLNLLIIWYFKIKKNHLLLFVKNYKHIVTGIIAGLCIHIPNLIIYNKTIDISLLCSATFLMSTFLIVLWEELWFRNAILIILNKRYALFSLFSASLFTTIHLLNPEFNSFSQFLDVFLGGYLLTISFLTTKSFLFPFFLHYSNNLIENLYKPEFSNISEIYSQSKILVSLILITFFILKLRKHEVSNNIYNK